jgi:hypothetical protein
MMFTKAADSFLAIDLAPDSVRVLDVALRRGVPSILDLAAEPLPEGTDSDLCQRHLAVLEKLLNSHRLRTRRCLAALPTTLVTTRSVVIDPARPQPPEEQIGQTLQNILSLNARDLLFDYWDVSQPRETGRAREVLVVAAQRSVVHRYLDGFQRLKLACAHLDVAPCALAGLIGRLLPEQQSMIGALALGATIGYFAMVHQQNVLFWRPFDMPSAKNGPQAALERIGDEVSKCVSHMLGAQHLDDLTQVVLFQMAPDSPVGGYLNSRFSINVLTPLPFDSLGPNGVSPALQHAVHEPSAQYAVALGLAWQGAGGNHG